MAWEDLGGRCSGCLDFFYRGIHPRRGDTALEHAQKYLGADRAGGCLVARHRGSRSSQADGIGQLAGHAQEAIQVLKVKTKSCVQ